MKYTKGIGAFLIALIFSAELLAVNQITQLVPFQGRLHNSEGNVVADGVYDLTFYIYETPTGGEFKWSENHAQVSVIHGYVNVLLGATDAGKFSGASVDFSKEKYLSISINGGQEMFPRHQLVPTFHSYDSKKLGGKEADEWATDKELENAINGVNTSINTINTNITTTISSRFVNSGNVAKEAIKLDGKVKTDFLMKEERNDLVPIGTVLIWPSNVTPPADYTECNGKYLNKSTYSSLYSVLGTRYGSTSSDFRVPDYRGLFLRGWTNGANQYDPSYTRAIGSVQTESFKSHTHPLIEAISKDHTGATDYSEPGSPLTGEATRGQVDRTTHIRATGGSETRPDNRAVMFIIKYK